MKEITINIDERTAKNCDSLFESLGLTTEEAISIFLHGCLINHGIPFRVALRDDIEPYEATKGMLTSDASVDKMEIGNILFGNSRGAYALERGAIEDDFSAFLEESGFDRYGHIENEEMENKYLQTEYGSDNTPCEKFKPVSVSEIAPETLHLLREMTSDIEPSVEVKLGQKTYRYKREVINMFDGDKEPEMLAIRDDKAEASAHHHYFENEVFILRPYYWGDSEEISKKPNFVFKPTGLEISWYKYPFRDSYANMPISRKELMEIIDQCKKSLSK